MHRLLALLFLLPSIAFGGTEESVSLDAAIEAYRNGQFAEAREGFMEIQQALHRKEGVWTLSQLDILDYLQAIAVFTGDQESVDRLQILKLSVVEQNYPANHPATISATLAYGEYQQLKARYETARDIFRQTSEQRMETGFNPAPIRLLKNQYLRGVCCKTSTFEEASLTLSEAQGVDQADRAKHLLDMGDLRVLSSRPETSVEYYREAGRAMPALRTHLSKPALIGISRGDRMARVYRDVIDESRQRILLSPLANTKSVGAVTGHPLPVCESHIQGLLGAEDSASLEARLALKVAPTGRAENVTVVASNAPARLTRLVKRLYEISRFRPALVDEDAHTEQIEITQSFTSPEDRGTGFSLSHVATIHACSALARDHDSPVMNGLANIR